MQMNKHELNTGLSLLEIFSVLSIKIKYKPEENVSKYLRPRMTLNKYLHHT